MVNRKRKSDRDKTPKREKRKGIQAKERAKGGNIQRDRSRGRGGVHAGVGSKERVESRGKSTVNRVEEEVIESSRKKQGQMHSRGSKVSGGPSQREGRQHSCQ